MQVSYADKTEIRTLSMDELSLVAGVAGLTGGPGVAAAAAAGGFVGGFGSTVVSDGWE